jgi:hypothetical protein
LRAYAPKQRNRAEDTLQRVPERDIIQMLFVPSTSGIAIRPPAVDQPSALLASFPLQSGGETAKKLEAHSICLINSVVGLSGPQVQAAELRFGVCVKDHFDRC